MVSLTHQQNIICSPIKLDDIGQEQTIICRQLFAGHVAGSRSMKRENNMHRIIINIYLMRLSMIWTIVEIEESTSVIGRGRLARGEISIILHTIRKPNPIMQMSSKFGQR